MKQKTLSAILISLIISIPCVADRNVSAGVPAFFQPRLEREMVGKAISLSETDFSTELREGVGVLVDSSQNGYGLIIPETNPISVNTSNPDQIIMAYRQYTDGSASGSIGMAYSDDGGNQWETYSSLNFDVGGVGRYPSALATEYFPVVLWNEYGGGGGDNGGRAYYTFDEGEYGGEIFYPSTDIHNNPAANDSWIVVPTQNVDPAGNLIVNTVVTDWSGDRDHIHFRAQTEGTWDSGTTLPFSSGNLLVQGNRDFLLSEGSNFTSNGNMDINSDGTGYYVVSSYWADTTVISNHTLFIKKTIDYGETWSDWFHLSDDALNSYFQEIFPDSLYDEVNNTWSYLPTGWMPFIGYDLEVLVDDEGDLHIFAGVSPLANNGVFSTWSEECGLYHFALLDDDFANGSGGITPVIHPIGSMQDSWANNSPGWHNNIMTAAKDRSLENHIYLVYYASADNGSGEQFLDLFGSFSSDDGNSWSEPLNITQTAFHDQDECFPHIARIADNGTVRIMYSIPDYNLLTLDPPEGPQDYLNRIYYHEHTFGPLNTLPSVNFVTALEVSDDTSTVSLEYGTAPTATDGYDVDFDIYAPPPPPTGAFDARFTVGGEDFLADYRETISDIIVWDVSYEAATGNTITLSWNPADFPAEGSFRLVDPFTGGDLVDIDMRTTDTHIPVYSSLQIVYSLTEVMIQDFTTEWNMIGLPLDVADPDYLSLYPTAIPSTLYDWGNSYQAATELTSGIGYWLRFPEAVSVVVEGFAITEQSWSLSEGWNMVSGMSNPVSLTSVNDADGIIIPNTFYGFNSAYYASDMIDPGMGYWIRTNAAGEVTFDGSGTTARSITDLVPESASVLEFTDADGNSQILFFNATLAEDVDLRSFSLPPVPPEGVFDVRFVSDLRLAEGTSVNIAVQGTDLAVTGFNLPALDVGEEWRLTLYSGTDNVGTLSLTEGTVNQITASEVDRMSLSRSVQLPDVYLLEQNYPNPFNPVTEIKYQLPEASQVRLTIYNTLGREVVTLESSEQAAGYHSVSWNSLSSSGSPVGTGVYFYRLQAGKYNAVKKMILLK